MSKKRPGRPRKFSARKPCGRLVQPTLAELEAARDAQRKKDEADAKAVARAQPHRAGFDDPEAKRLATALGRFCTVKKLPEHCYRGGRDYADLVRRWRSGKGIPGTYTEPRVEGADERSVEDRKAELDAMAVQIGRIDLELARLGHGVFGAIGRLVLGNNFIGDDIVPAAHYDAVIGLGQLAIEFGHVGKTLHPFGMALDEAAE